MVWGSGDTDLLIFTWKTQTLIKQPCRKNTTVNPVTGTGPRGIHGSMETYSRDLVNIGKSWKTSLRK